MNAFPASTSSRPRWPDLEPTWPNRESSQFVTAGGTTWHVQICGQGPILLLAHGTGAATFTWGALLPLLARHFTVVAPDLPGHGFTPAPQRDLLSLPGMASAVAALLATLHLDPVLAVGHSAGAAIVLRMAIDRRITPRLVVGLNPAIIPPPAAYRLLLAPFIHRLATTTFAASRAAALASHRSVVDSLLRSTGSDLPADQRDRYRRFFQSEQHCHDILTMMADWSLPDLVADLPRTHCPTTLIAGTRDHWVPLGPLRQVARAIPDVSLVTVDGGHLFHEAQPGLAASLILDAATGAGVTPRPTPPAPR